MRGGFSLNQKNMKQNNLHFLINYLLQRIEFVLCEALCAAKCFAQLFVNGVIDSGNSLLIFEKS